MATAGQDFGEYRQWLEAAGVDTSLVKVVDGKFTASFFCSTDQESNQIASFYTGAMANAAELSFRTVPDCRLTIISPNDPMAMTQYAEECRVLEVPFIWDPGQQCARMTGEELAERNRRRRHRHLQRLRIRTDPSKNRAGRRVGARTGGRARSSPAARMGARSSNVAVERMCRRFRPSASSIRPVSATRSAPGS